jgi:hypothetical protein
MKHQLLFTFLLLSFFSSVFDQKKNNLVGTWQCASFEYKKAGTNHDFQLSREDYESLVKFKATYTFDSKGTVKFSIADKLDTHQYTIQNKKLIIGGEEHATDTYLFKQVGDALQLIQNNKTFDLVLHLIRIK